MINTKTEANTMRSIGKFLGKFLGILAIIYGILFAVFYFDLDGKFLYYVW